MGRHPATARSNTAAAPPSPSAQQPQARTRELDNQQAFARPQPVPLLPPEPQTARPSSQSRSFVFASVPGQMIELDPLPIKMPNFHVQSYAPISKSAPRPISGENLAFVVFRRDFVSAPQQTVMVHVVATVRRTTKLFNGKPTIEPLEGIWQVRDKYYEFMVSPLEGRSEVVVIQPRRGFVLPAGRYALVLNGTGYDFVIAGPVTAPEQCMEEVQVVNETILTQCPNA